MVKIRIISFRVTRFIIIFFSLLTACVEAQEKDLKKIGENVDKSSEYSQKNTDVNSILVVDFGSNTRKIKPLSEFPESIRFKSRKRTVDGVDVISKVPVREIRIRPLDEMGNLTDASKAKIVSVQYLDENGAILESTTMQQDK